MQENPDCPVICYIPKPILERLGNPNKLKFVISGDDIMVRRPDE